VPDVVKKSAALMLGLILIGVACSSSDPAPSEDGDDSAGQQACDRFREVAAGAYGEALSESEVVAGLHYVGRIAQDSITPAIRDNGQQVAAEANAKAMISGKANPAQDALAEACNDTYPI
jgi:hypothetical protein